MGVALERLPALTDWVERLTARPSIAAEVELVAIT
jgi:glutathione S-transferase